MLAFKKVLKGEEGRAEMHKAGLTWIKDIHRRLLEIGMDELTSDSLDKVNFEQKMQRIAPDDNPLKKAMVQRCKDMMLPDSDDE